MWPLRLWIQGRVLERLEFKKKNNQIVRVEKKKTEQFGRFRGLIAYEHSKRRVAGVRFFYFIVRQVRARRFRSLEKFGKQTEQSSSSKIDRRSTRPYENFRGRRRTFVMFFNTIFFFLVLLITWRWQIFCERVIFNFFRPTKWPCSHFYCSTICVYTYLISKSDACWIKTENNNKNRYFKKCKLKQNFF